MKCPHIMSRDIGIYLRVCERMYTYVILLENFDFCSNKRKRMLRETAHPFPSPPSPSFPLAFWIFCRSGHVSIIESLASAATDEFQLVAGWPVSRGPRMGFPGFCTSSFHGTTRSFAFRPYLLHLLLLFHLSLVHLASLPSLPSLSTASLATDTAESLSIPICLSFHLTEPQTWRAFCRGLDGWISRASKPATELAQSGCEN